MNRLEKCEILKSKGYTYNAETGKIFNRFGKEIKRVCDGYIKLYNGLLGHHYAWYMTYGNVDFEMLDHINQIKNDNKICNLRSANPQINQQNRLNTTKGYTWHKHHKKWMSSIRANQKTYHLGYYDTEKEARQAYLNAKSIYHHLN